MRLARVLVIAATLSALLGPQKVSAQSPGTITDLGTLGGTRTTPIGINDLGDVVGLSSLAGDAINHAFLRSAGALRDLGTLPGHAISQARAINNRRQVVGLSSPPGLLGFINSRAFLWENEVMVDLNTPATAAAGWVLSAALGINDAGQIVGYGSRGGLVQRAFLLQNGLVTDLGTLGGAQAAAAAINRFGQIVGTAHAADGILHAVSWTNGVIRDLGGTGVSSLNVAAGINDFGEAAGSLNGDTTSSVPVFWDAEGTPVILPMLDPSANAYAINNLRQVAGAGASAAGTAQRAVVWQEGSAIDLEDVIPAGFNLVFAASLNNAGQVVGVMASGRGFLIQLPVSASSVGAVIESLVVGDAQTSLLAKLNGADGTSRSTCNVLRATLNEIRAQSGKQIAVDVAARLIDTIEVAGADCQ